MGFFDKFTKKISEAVSKAGEAVNETLNFNKIVDGLEKTRKSFAGNLRMILGAGRKIDAKLIDEIEEILITADIGFDTTYKIIESLKARIKKEGYEEASKVYDVLREIIFDLMIKSTSSENDLNFHVNKDNKPRTILIIGVNGVGKTTSIGKLAYNYKKHGREVLIGAADTFRAAANEQLEIWAQRAGVQIVQRTQGSDPGAVVYDTMSRAKNENSDVVLIDTAGRLHNKANLMAELGKLTRVMKKIKPEAPDEVFLVLDATTGQNALQQAREFIKVTEITGIILTKLDGTAKGGVVIPIATELQIPVRYIGLGEKINDLQVFDPTIFIGALFGTQEEESSG